MTERTVLITGGSRGIGHSCAIALADLGHRIAVTSRSAVDESLKAAGILHIKCDVTKSNDIETAFETIESEMGMVEILVCNAGITQDALTLRMSEEEFAGVIDTNLTGSFRSAKRALKRMTRARWGRIIFISSIAGRIGQTGQANYAASKAGLLGLARSLAKEFASRNITVNVVAPGPIATDMLNTLSEEQRLSFEKAIPLGRLGEAEDVAAAVKFLASEEARHITGALLPVDGGLSMG